MSLSVPSSLLTLSQYAHSLRLAESDPYYPWEARWLADKGCAERYMRAAKFKLDDAKRRIAGTLEWRREFKPDLIRPEDVRVESETGKMYEFKFIITPTLLTIVAF